MLYEIFDNMHLCTPEAVEKMLPLVSPQRRDQALQFSHTFGQFFCLKSYMMLLELIAAVYPELDGARPTFAYTAHGKPYIAERPDIHFNISHTKAGILVAISKEPIGVDIETFRSPSEGLVNKTMNDLEREAILRSPLPDRTFTALWTRKEALLKLQATGIISPLPDILATAPNVEYITHVFPRKQYAFSIAQYPPSSVRMIV